VRLWDPTTGGSLGAFYITGAGQPLTSFADLDLAPTPAPPAPTEPAALIRLATAGSDHQIRLWDVHNGQHLAAFAGHQMDVNAVTFSPDGRLLASAGADRTARVWDVATGRALHVLHGHDGEVTAVAF